MRDATPNGRDYYPQGAAALNLAAEEHSEGAAAVQRLAEYYDALLMHLTDQPD